MNLQHLKYFVELAHMHNYSAAAESLHITQPSLSYAISQLEEELGVPLFVRSGRQNVLSSYGEQFLQYAEGAIRSVDQGIEAIYASVHQETVIRIGFLRFLGIQYVPRLLDLFMKEHPEYAVRFECETGSTKLLLDGLNANRFDAVFCAPAAQVRRFGVQICKQKLYLVVPEGHPLSRRKSVRLEDTYEYPYVYYVKGSGMRNVIEAAYPGLSASLDIRYRIMEERVVLGFVAAGLGIGIVPQMALMETLPVVKIDIEEPAIERDIYMIPTATRERTPALEAFLKFIRKHADPEDSFTNWFM